MLTRLTTTLILQYIPIMAYVNYYASIKKKKKHWAKVVKIAGERGWRTLKLTLRVLDFNHKPVRRLLRVLSKEETG